MHMLDFTSNNTHACKKGFILYHGTLYYCITMVHCAIALNVTTSCFFVVLRIHIYSVACTKPVRLKGVSEKDTAWTT